MADKEPWEMTKEEAGADPRIKLGGPMDNILARVDIDGKVILSDDFFEHGIEARKEIWAHEKAHFKTDAVRFGDDFWRITDSHLFGRYNEKLERWEAAKGFSGRNVNEALTQAVADYEVNPSLFAQKYPQHLPIIKAISEGKPLPTELAKAEAGHSTTETLALLVIGTGLALFFLLIRGKYS